MRKNLHSVYRISYRGFLACFILDLANDNTLNLTTLLAYKGKTAELPLDLSDDDDLRVNSLKDDRIDGELYMLPVGELLNTYLDQFYMLVSQVADEDPDFDWCDDERLWTIISAKERRYHSIEKILQCFLLN